MYILLSDFLHYNELSCGPMFTLLNFVISDFDNWVDGRVIEECTPVLTPERLNLQN